MLLNCFKSYTLNEVVMFQYLHIFLSLKKTRWLFNSTFNCLKVLQISSLYHIFVYIKKCQYYSEVFKLLGCDGQIGFSVSGFQNALVLSLACI